MSRVNREAEGDELRAKLRALGVNPGPITHTTRSVYLKLLERLQQRGPLLPPPLPLERSPGVLFFPSKLMQSPTIISYDYEI